MPNTDCDFCKQGIKHTHHHRHADNLNRCLYDDEQGISHCDFEENTPTPLPPTGGVVASKPLNALETYRRAQQTEGLLAEWLSWAEEWGDRDMRQSLIARTKSLLEK